MSGIIDTNILLYAANSDADEHRIAFDFLTRAGKFPGAWYFTEGILYEFLRVSTHSRVFPKPLTWKQAVQFCRPFLMNQNFQILFRTDRHWSLLEDVLKELNHAAGNLFFDIRTVVMMRENGVRRIYTTDTDFLQFSGIEVLNPLRQ